MRQLRVKQCLALALLATFSAWARSSRGQNGQIAFTTTSVQEHPEVLFSGESKSVHLSHSGLYLSSPISKGSPPYLSLAVDPLLYDLDSIKITIGPGKQRSWEEVFLECGSASTSSIEACEDDDLREARSMSTSEVNYCAPYKVIPSQSRILLHSTSCPSLKTLLATDQVSIRSTETYLDSLTISFDIQRVFPTRREIHVFWIGQIVRATEGKGDGGALWPYGQEKVEGDKTISKDWDGRQPNKISSQMQDPYLPKAYQAESNDILNGVDLIDSTWSYGISILSPTNGNVSKPGDRESEPVHSPISGQIVWTGSYTIPMAPSNHRNDEHGYAIMIRDDWGFVYQILGLEASSMKVSLGDVIDAGHMIGASSRHPLSYEPSCRHKPADPPKMYDDSRRYPYRNRVLRIRVARPDPAWKEWKSPLDPGWQYFNPLDAFTSDNLQSSITPDVNPHQLYFGRPSEDGGLTPPSIFATSKDLIQPPTLSGNVEIITGFDVFISTPGYDSAIVEPTALHALEWAVWPKSEAKVRDSNDQNQDHCELSEGVEWRTTFEHSKLPNNWSNAYPKTALLAHYVPAFVVGSIPFFKTKYASAFDEKSRKLYYSPTRNSIGLPDSKGCWDTTREPSGDGIYRVLVRGRDWFGNVGCLGADVRIRNAS